MSEYFAVISGDPRYACEEDIAVFSTLGDAVEHRDCDDLDRRVVYALKQLPESALWDWAVRHPTNGLGVMEYVSERAARSCRGVHGTLLRRRAGTTEWTEVPEGGETP